MKECFKEKNLSLCTCTYEPCSRKGLCCECILYHRKKGEIPGCFFPGDKEKTYNRSLQFFLKCWK